MTLRPKLKQAASVAREALSIDEFCAAYNLSRGFFYKLKQRGEAPRIMHLGGRQLISREAAADWVREREAASAAAA